ncbi:hypothetical protein BG011_007464 [Mortierella polycephala]|uniref:Uncharacterized protein n=1 Tax=Mortierella polycephala TaxID=41804 RepID=A0A9P6TY82_9FUNG|nr:hypothetical protein BG011_007464 [Mortierella polycephala]
MASILFDDITFPRELYDPDTFEFVPPVSTLLSFTPHILSQLAKSSESEQEPLPIPEDTTPTDRNKETNKEANQEEATASTSSSSSSSGFFSTIKNFASSHGTQRIVENGLYMAGRYMDGSAASASARASEAAAAAAASSSSSSEHRYSNSSRRRSQDSFWFGYRDHGDQERQRLKEMKQRLQQMEHDMRYNTAMARSEIEAQRRERYKLEQELETQQLRVKKLEAEMEEQQRQNALQNQQKQKEEEERQKQQQLQEEEKRRAAQTSRKQKEAEVEKSKSKSNDSESESEDEQDKDSEKKALLKKSRLEPKNLDTNTVIMATVGAASLVMSLYSAHKASSTYSVVSFHDQLEVLMSQCESAVQSTEAWISEQFLEVPDQICEDLKLIKELMETIQRLDPRSEKKAEAMAWGMSAVGSLGAVGGVVLGSMTAMASGGTVVVGCALYGIITRARYNGPEYSAARVMMEVKAAQTLRALGVSPTNSSPASTFGGRATLIHDSRIERLRIEFEKREGHDLRDADEIDGLAVEEALRESSFSAPFVSQKASAKAERARQQSIRIKDDFVDVRTSKSMKTESNQASAYL